MIYYSQLLRTKKFDIMLLNQISSTLRHLSSEVCYKDFPESSNILCDENRQNCVRRFKAIKISPRIKVAEDRKKAAVLIPLCLVKGELSLLYTLRRADLKRHRGQVSFPGGIQDPTDKDLEETALRETEEELGISRNQVDLWGSGSIVIGTEFSVLPVLGSLGSIELENLQPNPDEVESVFAITLQHFCEPQNCRYTQFRTGPDKGYVLPTYTNAKHRVWGITALMTHIVLTSLIPQHYNHKLQYIKPIVLSDPVL
jgi:nudix motif 8